MLSFKHHFIFLFVVIIFQAQAQKSIVLEDIFENGTFGTRSIPDFNFMKDGKYYSRLSDGNIVKYDFTTGEAVEVILNNKDINDASNTVAVESYSFSNDEKKILIESGTESIYRHSSMVDAYVFDIASKKLQNVYPHGKIINPQFSPDGEKVAFVHKNNLYYTDLKSQNTTQVTTDGEINAIINGQCDWVYEEEFGFTRAFFWSPDSKKIAYLRFDESAVKQYVLQYYEDDLYPFNYTYKYPKVGEKNADVSAYIHNFSTGKSHKINLPEVADSYIPRLKWTEDPNELCIYHLNRHQNNLKLYLASTKYPDGKLLYEEKNKYYIDINDHLTFINENKNFVLSSEMEGYNRLYLYNMDGKISEKISPPNYEVTVFHGVDQKSGVVYFEAITDSPLENHLYSVQLNGKNLKALTPQKGRHSATFTKTFDYFSDAFSTANTPPTYAVYNNQGKLVRTIETNQKTLDQMKDYATNDVEFFTFVTSENVKLNGWMIKPMHMNPNKKYPVFMTQYSGPGSQSVTDGWLGRYYWWYQLLAQNGYIVACVDGRGTGGRGEEFKKMTYLQLGHYETIDQIEAAKYLGRQPYVDKERIGIFGWSYGGYMSSLCLLKGNDVFKAGIAVAPVTNWKWYDSVYTERYMRTVEENSDGYVQNSPVYFADRLKGSYLLVHGLTDDNVHFQHSAEMANALIKSKKQFDTYYYPNRNHGIYGDNARIHLFTKITDFIFAKI